MKKNVLALSIAAMIGGLGFAGAASAQLAVNDSGTGHMLINPYYTAQNGNMSVFHVVNTDTTHGKAVKVRFRGASNSDDVLDFQVFMSPGDVWTAAISQGDDGVAKLVTYDNSCTLPTIGAGDDIRFITDRLPSAMTAADKANNTREGYVEILNMADINPSGTLFTAIKHKSGVAPCTPSTLDATLVAGYDKVKVNGLPTDDYTGDNLLPPTDGLTGSWYVINVPESTTYSGASNAIVVASDETTNVVFSPQNNGKAAPGTSADPLFKAGIIQAQLYDIPDLSTPYLGSITDADAQALALNNLLARNSVINQYANDAAIAAKTDWVFSMPTRRYAIAANYSAPIGQGFLTAADYANTGTPGTEKAAAYRIINDAVESHFSDNTLTKVNSIGQICVSSISFSFYDREESAKTSGAVFSPGTVTQTPLCGEVSVLSFNDAGPSALGSSVARTNVTGAYTNGWGQINFALPGATGGGVPVLGAAFLKVSNPGVMPGVAGNFGITWPHAYKNSN